MATHPFWGDDADTPPAQLPPQAVYDNLVKTLERARSHQLELASLQECGVVLSSADQLSGTHTFMPPPMVLGQTTTPQRGGGGSENRNTNIGGKMFVFFFCCHV